MAKKPKQKKKPDVKIYVDPLEDSIAARAAEILEEKKRGPKPDRVKIGGRWEDAIDKALKKERPPGGWPKSTK